MDVILVAICHQSSYQSFVQHVYLVPQWDRFIICSRGSPRSKLHRIADHTTVWYSRFLQHVDYHRECTIGILYLSANTLLNQILSSRSDSRIPFRIFNISICSGSTLTYSFDIFNPTDWIPDFTLLGKEDTEHNIYFAGGILFDVTISFCH